VEGVLNDPFDPALPPFSPPLPAALQAHLEAAVGEGCAANHFSHAKAAEAKLQDLINDDIAESEVAADQFGLFLAFAHDVLDRYGRFLTFPTLGRISRSDSSEQVTVIDPDRAPRSKAVIKSVRSVRPSSGAMAKGSSSAFRFLRRRNLL
jgi:hypothetical protein